MTPNVRQTGRRYLPPLVALGVATVVWLPSVHLFFSRPSSEFWRASGVSPLGGDLATRQLRLWTEPALRAQELAKMRRTNAEWDFMGRSFLVWSLANLGLREPGKRESYLTAMDAIIRETLQMEERDGMFTFLMPYARVRPYLVSPARSLFLDGEIALMLGARRMLQEDQEYRQMMRQRLSVIEDRLVASPVLSAESYPNECWTFDHAVALAALKVGDRLDATDHSAVCSRWVTMAKDKLVHRSTGLLVSSYQADGTPLDGPEGSTIWMVAHCLQVVDTAFAQDQYRRARRELGRVTLGFGYAVEWPASWRGARDVDSGMIIPGLGVSAGSSGMALIAAAAFGDHEFLRQLVATLDMAAFPSRAHGGLKYCASNQVGDAAMLYATTVGPLWERVLGR